MTEVTRSMEATSPVMAAVVDQRRKSMPSGWWGVLLFVCSETTFFGLMIASYFYTRFQNTAWPPVGVEKPKVALPLVLTGILISSTVPLFAAVRAGKARRVGLAWTLVAVAVAIQGAYLGLQVHEYLSDLDKMRPHGSAYASVYFTLVGAHHIHVAAGILLELWLISRLIQGMTNYRLIALRITALYWYFVAAVAVPVVFTQIFPSL